MLLSTHIVEDVSQLCPRMAGLATARVVLDGPGDSMLVESLAKYSELKVTRKIYGDRRTREFLDMELDRYLFGRPNEPNAEPPLARIGAQGYISYAKVSLVVDRAPAFVAVDPDVLRIETNRADNLRAVERP